MLPIVYAGNPAWLIPFAPNTGDALNLKVHVDLDEQRSETGRSSRRPQARLLRCELGWVAQMKLAEFVTARANVQSAQDEPVLCPFWPAARKVSGAAIITAANVIAWTRDWSSYALNPGSLAAYDSFAPALVGYMKQPPRLAGKTSDVALGEFAFVEDGPAAAALVPPANADITFITPDGFAAPVFPFAPEGSQIPKLTFGQVEVERQPIGPGRQTAGAFFPQTREAIAQPFFKFKNAAEAMSLLGWWFRRGGGADALWLPTTQSLGQPLANLAAGAGVFDAPPLAGVAVGDTLALLTTGRDAELVRVAAIVDHGTYKSYTLAAALGAAHARAWTTIVPAILARHTDSELALDFLRSGDDWLASATLGFREVAAEYAVAGGETRGTTVGRLPAQAWLFKLSLNYSGAMQDWFLTNFESGVTTSDAQVWQYNPIDFDKLTLSIDPEEAGAELTARWFAGGPWENWLPGNLAATGTLTIYRANVNTLGVAGPPILVWAGELAKPTIDIPIVKQKVAGNALFARLAPHIVMRPACWKRLYGAACALNIADWKFNAVISAIGAHTITINTITRANGGALPAGFAFADWFALGWVSWLNGSGQPLRSEILASTVLAGGAITLTVGRPLGWLVGDAVVAVPGCDKTAATCWNYDPSRTFDPVGNLGKFDNHDRFGGARQMPAVSPNFIIPQKNSTPAKK